MTRNTHQCAECGMYYTEARARCEGCGRSTVYILPSIALKELHDAIIRDRNGDNDVTIVKLWDMHRASLHSYAPAQAYVPRVHHAQKCLAAIRTIAAVKDDGIALLKEWNRYADLLEAHHGIQPYAEAIAQAQQTAIAVVRQALQREDDAAIVGGLQALPDKRVWEDVFSAQERERIDIAFARTDALRKIWAALETDEPATVVEVYTRCEHRILPYKQLTGAQRARIAECLAAVYTDVLQRAIDAHNHEQIIQAGNQLMDVGYPLHPEHLQQMENARQILKQAALLREAMLRNDDAAIGAMSQSLDVTTVPGLSDEHRARIELASQRTTSGYLLREALTCADNRTIRQHYDAELFRESTLFTAEQQQQLAYRHHLSEFRQRLWQAVCADDDEAVLTLVRTIPKEQYDFLTAIEQHHVERVQHRVSQLRALHDAIATNDPVQIDGAFQALDHATRRRLPAEVHQTVRNAHYYCQQLQAFRQALDEGNLAAVAAYGVPLKRTRRALLTSDEVNMITQAVQHQGALLRSTPGADYTGEQRIKG